MTLDRKDHVMNPTLATRPTARSVRLLLLMEQKQKAEIGQRIKELRKNSAETNRSIAEFVGVSERTVAGWIAGEGISYANAEKVAELFGVDVDWIWRGRSKGETPDLMGRLSEAPPDRLEAIEQRLARIELILDAIREAAGLPAPDQDELREAAARLRADLTPAQRQ